MVFIACRDVAVALGVFVFYKLMRVQEAKAMASVAREERLLELNKEEGGGSVVHRQWRIVLPILLYDLHISFTMEGKL